MKDAIALQVEAITAFQERDFSKAESLFRRAVVVAPDSSDAFNNLGISLRAQGKIGESIEAFSRAVHLNPDLACAHASLGANLVHHGFHQKSLEHLSAAVKLEPGVAQTWLDMVPPLALLGQFDAALIAFQTAGNLDPALTESAASRLYLRLGLAYMEFGQEHAGLVCLRESMFRRFPGASEETIQLQIHAHIGLHLQLAGRVDEAIEWFEKAVSLGPANILLHGHVQWCHQYGDRVTPEESTSRAVKWAAAYAPASLIRHRPGVRKPGRLRIGYLSADFWDRSHAYTLAPLLRHHDRSRFEIFLYSNNPQRDWMTDKLRELGDHWRSISELDDDSACELIEQDEIDILIDLAGFTEANRLGIFARKPARVQAQWLGYYATMGMPQMDYFICNPALVPPDEECLWIERPMHLKGEAFAFEVQDEPIPIRPLPALQNGFVTFGSCAYLAKVTPEVVRIWAQVLREVPRSRLIMNRQALQSPMTRERFLAMFESHGIHRCRITMMSTTTRLEYMEKLGDIDVLLDTFPFNGSTTIYEALWMGVPTITLSARRTVGHFGESILEPLGLEECVARTPEEFVQKAVVFVQDLSRLSEIRSGLRERFTMSPLCDAAAFTLELEDAFERMAA
ncbi:MAG TPA: tetratricopeptide repeat protein [Fimbriimonas sp.]|nr:tetratricopeptide repeat protein [Fimbriimonas sp.]